MPENNKKQCPHNCLQCGVLQQIYCTSQNVHDILMLLRESLGSADKVSNSTDGDGAENRDPNEQPQNIIEQ